MDTLLTLAAAWHADPTVGAAALAAPEALASFQRETNLLVPADMAHYFLTVNGSNDKYDDNFFAFCSLAEFTSIQSRFADYPEHCDLLHTFAHCETCYVFADFMINLMAYAVQLYPDPSQSNTVYMLCGGQYKIVANSFTEFLDLYVSDYGLVLL